MKVVITGSSGMIGQGVLLECLESDNVSEILLVNRRSIVLKKPKIKEKSRRGSSLNLFK